MAAASAASAAVVERAVAAFAVSVDGAAAPPVAFWMDWHFV
jgi:hypothetical protein